jgi:glycosyltransferase involved in cell wall biosynthesis
MRLLMLTPSLPYPPHQGGAIRNYGILYGLHAAGHDITLLSFHDGSPAVDSTPLVNLCSRIETVPFPQRATSQRLRELALSSQPDLANRLRSAEFRYRIQSLLAQTRFDLIQFEGLEMATYLPLTQDSGAKLCYDAHNAEYALQKGIFEVDLSSPLRWPSAAYSLIQSNRIARFERLVCQQVDCVIAVSDEDADTLRRLCPHVRLSVIPNGIFADAYDETGESLDLGKNVLTFTGKMDYRPNVDAMLWFTGSIFPQVQKRVRDARLYIVGQKPHPRLESLREKPNIEITGWVPEIRPFLHATSVYVAPLRMGSGTRLKILEAMAAGCAVVATTLAAAGLPQAVKNALLIADSESDMSEAIVALLQDETRRKTLGSAAQVAIKQHYDWSLLIPRLLTTYKEIGLG